jgi:oligopeptide transport system ATP-binding protein
MAVMYLGKIVELTDRDEIYLNPLHPYTQALMSAVPVPDPEVEEKRKRIILEGDIPSPAHPPEGCNFNTRCPSVMDVCYKEEPEFLEVKPGHFVACHRVT